MIHTKATLGIWVNSPLMTFLKVSWSGRPPFSHFRNWIGFWMQNFLLLILHDNLHVTVAQKRLFAVVECAADNTGLTLIFGGQMRGWKTVFLKTKVPLPHTAKGGRTPMLLLTAVAPQLLVPIWTTWCFISIFNKLITNFTN